MESDFFIGLVKIHLQKANLDTVLQVIKFCNDEIKDAVFFIFPSQAVSNWQNLKGSGGNSIKKKGFLFHSIVFTWSVWYLVSFLHASVKWLIHRKKIEFRVEQWE